ncbi:site-specific integrase [Sporosarcina beigongshangi]|uniref:site-specific integrase n=1 Tax=Sporosarcina beigongshangi TaxID=2782538 RepID=UPI0019393156|nr:site-specific integrase [Sporosarcina beigongshangi]
MENLINFKFVVKENEIEEFIDSKVVKKRVVNIGLYNKIKKVAIPHPLTDFIRRRYEYQGSSINTVKAPAYVLCRFLNYIIDRISAGDEDFNQLVHEGISGLKLIHGSRYITHLTNTGLKRSTVFYYENYIKEFYLFLKEQSLLNDDIDFKSYQDEKGNWLNHSPFRSSSLGTKYPSRTHNNNKFMKLKDFGPNRNKLIIEFLEEAKETAPEIAFALCLQFFGGLRRGEVVNITRADLSVKFRKSLSVQIRDNRSTLFTHLKDTSAESPKRLNYLETHLAKQMILDSDVLWDYYESHMKDLDIKLKSGFLKNPMILFYDKNGMAISGRVYDKRFRKVKKSFLTKLATSAGREDDYMLLKDSYWSTHIGRGIFTSFLLDMDLSVLQIAIARGDTSIESVLDYVDAKTTIHYIEGLQNELHNVPKEEFGSIDQTVYKTKWLNGVATSVRKTR